MWGRFIYRVKLLLEHVYKVFIAKSQLHCNCTVTHSFSCAQIAQINFAEGRPPPKKPLLLHLTLHLSRIQSVLLKVLKLTSGAGML